MISDEIYSINDIVEIIGVPVELMVGAFEDNEWRKDAAVRADIFDDGD